MVKFTMPRPLPVTTALGQQGSSASQGELIVSQQACTKRAAERLSHHTHGSAREAMETRAAVTSLVTKSADPLKRPFNANQKLL